MSTETLELLKFALAVVNTFGVAGVAVYTWWVNRDRATAAAIDSVKAQLAASDERNGVRIAALEQRMGQAEHELRERLRLHDLEDLYESLNRMNREIGEMSAKLSGLSAQWTLVQEYLMKTRMGDGA